MKNEELRSVKVFKNTAWAIGGYVLYALAGFISRSIFIAKLGQEIAGVATLFNSILGLLSMAELGFAGAIAVHLYKPVAQEDERKIAALLNLYRRACFVIAAAIFVLGLLLLPFVRNFAKSSQQLPHLEWYFFLYLCQSVCSYFFAYRGILLTASQQGYVKSNITNLFLIVGTLLQALALYTTGSFTLYLLIFIVNTLLTNVVINLCTGRRYSFLKTYSREVLPKEERRKIFSFIKATAVDRMAIAVKSATDNMIISGFVNVLITGIVGNYTMIITTVNTLLNFFFTNATDATGNLVALSDKKAQYHTLLDIEFVSLWLVGFLSTGMLCTLTPFVCKVWLHNDALALPFSTQLLLMINFYLTGICWPVHMFFSVKGLIKRIPYMNVLNVVLNLVISLGLVSVLGVNGVFIGTILSYFSTTFLLTHYFVLGQYFENEYKPFLSLLFRYTAATGIAAMCCVSGCRLIGDSLIGRIVLCTLVFNGIFFVCSFRSREFRALTAMLSGMAKQVFPQKRGK